MAGKHVWVISAGVPAGAVYMDEPFMGQEPFGAAHWLTVNMLGQHIPQCYKTEEIRTLTQIECAALGLCPPCHGYGVTGALPPHTYSWDQIPKALLCGMCMGSGRPAVRIHVTRDASGVIGEMSTLPHKPVKAAQAMPGLLDVCLACGWPLDEAEIHQLATPH